MIPYPQFKSNNLGDGSRGVPGSVCIVNWNRSREDGRPESVFFYEIHIDA